MSFPPNLMVEADLFFSYLTADEFGIKVVDLTKV